MIQTSFDLQQGAFLWSQLWQNEVLQRQPNRFDALLSLLCAGFEFCNL